MSAELNTARALLRAENFEGARRIVRKALDENPGDLRAWDLRIEIEMEAKEYKLALQLTRQVLANHPDNASVREMEFFALARLRKKREAKQTLEQFRKDFPFQTGRIRIMTMVLDSLSERTKYISDALEEYYSDSNDPLTNKLLGIAHHKANDLWTAKRLLLEAHPHFPNDAELNAALATNYFQLVRPGTARKYARMALAANPADRRMTFLSRASWAMYFPPVFLFSVVLMFFFSFDRVFGRIPAYILTFVPYYFLIDLSRVSYSIFNVLSGLEWNRTSLVMTLVWCGIYALAISPDFYAKFLKPRKSVTLKKY